MNYPNYFQEFAERLAKIEDHLLVIAEHHNLFRTSAKSGIKQGESQDFADLLTAEQLRERLNICKASERVYVRSGILKPQYLGRRVYYSWNQVTAAMANTQEQLLPTKLRGRKKAANQI